MIGHPRCSNQLICKLFSKSLLMDRQLALVLICLVQNFADKLK